MTLRDDAILLSGFIYGTSSNIPTAIREALKRVADHDQVVRTEANIEIKPPTGVSLLSEGFAKTAAAPAPALRPAPAVEPAPPPANPFNPSGKRVRRKWTPEQKAEQAARIRAYHKARREGLNSPGGARAPARLVGANRNGDRRHGQRSKRSC